ncbi:PTS sugar transporter subunit IIA [Clostridium intestinale]|uniref:PTS system fructose subfamily transporter subunit IIA n=2 Tax=Clostridium intestinale TaxID=36845 RepID=U2NP86_9CLOT|nr:PTS sugar transporter subunit IIA [Clostridium intestinale]ERK30651.1 PTS system fructose subfamily transporter subunit IIA [Clostridium intestinale URNW]QLY81371.1 PTS sugar transporter subunit IIA [Clostridium intestinale]
MINKELIILDSYLETKEEIIQFLSEKAYNLGYTTNLDDFIGAVRKREEEFSTAVGYGVSIPHGKSEAVNEAFIAFLRLKNPILWDDEGHGPVKLVFLLGVPESKKETLHLKILAQISRKLMDEDFRNNLVEENEKKVYELLMQIEENIK